MIKIVGADPKQLKQVIHSTKWITDTIGVDAPELIPLDLGGLMPQTQTINELGKQLLRAAGKGNIEEIRTLMTKGAPFTADWLGTSPLHLAAQNNHLEVCEVLLRAGISRDARTKVDRTPLHMASYEGHIKIVECLLKHGADYDCRDMLCMTPLHWAAQNGHADVATMLIRYGATTTLVNKFDLTASDLASQINRHDIVEIINVAIRDPLIATQHLQLEMTGDSNDTIEPMIDLTENDVDNPVPIETILMEEVDSENSTDPEKLPEAQNSNSVPEQSVEVNSTSSYLESIKYLQERGITMLPADNNNILNSVIENGHTVVLTEAGKQVLNSIKPSEPPPIAVTPKNNVKQQSRENNLATVNMKKIITVTPEEFLAMTTNCNLTSNNVLKQANSKPSVNAKACVKRIVMKKNKTSPISATINISKIKKLSPPPDIEDMKKKLAEANKVIEEYKIRLKKKEAEAERYKQQLILILQTQ